MPTLALKVDVDTFRGTRYGVPRLLELLQQFEAGATFLFSLGPDHTGRAIKRAFRPGFFGKVSRTSVVTHYGLRTLTYGTLLPGPDIGKRAAAVMRATRDAGFEVGIHCWDHVKWQDGVERADAAWTEAEMDHAVTRFADVFGTAPHTHGAAGWQMNAHALRLTQRFGFAYSSDCRGTHPFVPVCNAEIVLCPQLPTTLPTLDELIGVDGTTDDNVHEKLLALTAAPRNHVYTLHAELEGMRLSHVFEKLLAGWQDQGYELVALNTVAHGLNVASLPRHEMLRGELPGRSGTLMVQGPPFLANVCL
ncbi:MAG TPA: polysaccharide deacetylase family protein [Rhodocyclaceae bacterium]|nr:polysaccharide deacetylase family protein [Rhodocyclaceae bacterium]